MDDPRLGTRARALIEDVDNKVAISMATFREIAIKVGLGKLPLDRPYGGFVAECLQSQLFDLLPIEPSHTTFLASMPAVPGHKDPFDRLLIAQAIVEGVPIVTADVAFDAYPVRRIW